MGCISWTKYSAAAKHPCFGGISWTKYSGDGKHPCFGSISWTKYSGAAKHPCLGGISWTKYSGAAQHPCLSHISRINYYHRGEMSWKQPLFKEKILPQSGNVLETATFQGENTAAKGKCPEKSRKTGRNHGRREKMSRKQQQFREKLQPHRENVLESSTKPGENSDTGRGNYFPERTSTAFKISLSS